MKNLISFILRAFKETEWLVIIWFLILGGSLPFIWDSIIQITEWVIIFVFTIALVILTEVKK
jgi:hypothetical protein